MAEEQSSAAKKQVPTDYQSSLARAERIAQLPRGSHVHIIGICGTGMAAVASLLKQLGFRVTGSDKAFYPPMGDVVARIAERLSEGYSAENLRDSPDFVVIGNSVSRGNPEVEAVIEKGIPFGSMPEVFQALLIGSHDQCRNSIVVAGTHGKTTTTAAVIWLLESAGLRPGYFVGGVPRDLPEGVRAVDRQIPAEKRCVVLEGDEYDSAFFAKWPKFLSYRPDLLVVTSLEFDHADIYESVERIEAEFTRLAMSLPRSGHVVVCLDDDRPRRLAREWAGQENFLAELHGYGSHPEAEFKLLSREPFFEENTGKQRVRYGLRGREIECVLQLSGLQNALNLLAAAAIGDLLGVSGDVVKKGLESFHGVLRRQQVLSNVHGVTVIEDFAHHPTAVRITLEGIRESYPGRRIVAVFEPRSNTSRRAFFQDLYPKSFLVADLVVIKEVTDPGGYSGVRRESPPLNVTQIIRDISSQGMPARSFREVEHIESFLLDELRAGDVVVLMSNGDFGGLTRSLVEALKNREAVPLT